ncbi:MAG: hypothetical protein H7Y01_14045, partial [Ferruginibacter sp.]|nr:hypothetical protein [Chitinophagaceae bacterium]
MKATTANRTNLTSDLAESAGDKQHMQQEEIIMDMPGVKDIPGQEHIHPPKMNAFADVTASSDGEEGKGLLDFDDDPDNDGDISTEENELLEKSVNSTGGPDDESQARATLDNTDDEGEPLNEDVDASGNDLDVPGSEEDDE